MKKLIVLLSIVSISFISCKEEKAKQTKEQPEKKEVKKDIEKPVIKKEKDVIIWRGYKPTGSHVGTIDVQSANFKFDGENLIGGKVVFDMNTIKNNDLKDAGDNADLVNHLKSTDFFDVISHPTATFEITEVKSDKEGKLQIDGNLTLNGITKKISFPATISDSKILKSDIIKIDRTDFGVKYKSKKFFANLKDKFINDKFDIAFKIQLK
jgi:hypothetical protein